MRNILLLLSATLLAACGSSSSEPREPSTSSLYLDCKPEIVKKLALPDSIDVKISTATSRDLNEGKELRFKFTAKNAFNADMPYTAVCEFDADGSLIKADIFEQVVIETTAHSTEWVFYCLN